MIGVVANHVEHSIVGEFFELFNTPWEFYRPGAHYDILLCSNSRVPDNNAKLLLLMARNGRRSRNSTHKNAVSRGLQSPFFPQRANAYL